MNATIDTIMLLLGHIETRAIQSAVLRSQLDTANTALEEMPEEAAAPAPPAFEEEPDAGEDGPVCFADIEGADAEEEVVFEPCGGGWFCEHNWDINGVGNSIPADLKTVGNVSQLFIRDTPEAREWAINTLRKRNNAN